MVMWDPFKGFRSGERISLVFDYNHCTDSTLTET